MLRVRCRFPQTSPPSCGSHVMTLPANTTPKTNVRLENSSPRTGDTPLTRRQALAGLAAGTALGFPTIVPARALGRDGAVAPSEKINLGVIGIGPRCTYVLTSMLGLGDVRCAAIADVQQSRQIGRAHV